MKLTKPHFRTALPSGDLVRIDESWPQQAPCVRRIARSWQFVAFAQTGIIEGKRHFGTVRERRHSLHLHADITGVRNRKNAFQLLLFVLVPINS
jgi:hypothetical protein